MALRFAVLASGSGSNAGRLFELSRAGTLAAEPVLLLCYRPGAHVLKRAAEAGVPAGVLDHTAYADREQHDRAMVAALREAGVELVVMAGYMRLVTPYFLQNFPERVINIHPAILPAFPGLRGAGDALDYGVRLAGCTVHFVEEKTDYGPVIIQAAVPVMPEDTPAGLQNRIHALEHRIYPQAVQWFAEGRVRAQGRKVSILPDAARRPAAPDASALVWPPLEEPF
jgi:phosphoribosylglycinamide formyltransferase-1